jgi:acetyl esterase/lipase
MTEADTLVEAVPVRLPARDIPPPGTVSVEAQAVLSVLAAAPGIPRAAADDLGAWRVAVEGSDAMWEPVASEWIQACAASVETQTIAGVPCHVGTPAGHGAADRIYLYFHGGGFVFGGGAFARAFAAVNADRLGLTTVSVDYRMAPDHPFPAAPEDGVAVYRALVARHGAERIVVGGSSAGGNLAAVTVLMARDQGLPLPAGVILLTPEVDLTESGDSFRTNAELDVVLKGPLPEMNALYAAGHDLSDPYLSPLFADFTRGYAPTLIQTGTRDLFLSNSALIHRKLREAGIAAELHVWEAMPHGGFGFDAAVPENREIDEEVKRFIDRHCPPR